MPDDLIDTPLFSLTSTALSPVSSLEEYSQALTSAVFFGSLDHFQQLLCNPLYQSFRSRSSYAQIHVLFGWCCSSLQWEKARWLYQEQMTLQPGMYTSSPHTPLILNVEHVEIVMDSISSHETFDHRLACWLLWDSQHDHPLDAAMPTWKPLRIKNTDSPRPYHSLSFLEDHSNPEPLILFLCHIVFQHPLYVDQKPSTQDIATLPVALQPLFHRALLAHEEYHSLQTQLQEQQDFPSSTPQSPSSHRL